MGKRILVTGGAGFIGSNFIEHIFDRHPDYDFVVLDALTYAGDLQNIPPHIHASGRFEFWHGDVNNQELVSDLVGRSDFIVHFAAETHVARSLYSHREFFTTDVLGTQSVAHAVMKHAKRVERFVHVSTSEVYGTAVVEPMDESHPLEPTSPYAGAKAGADRLVASYVIAHEIPATIVRPFNNYGPKQHLEKVIPRFITSCILGEELTIHGEGTAARDWLFVHDTARAIDAVLHAPADQVVGEVFNFGTGEARSVLDLANAIRAHFENPPGLTFIGERSGQVDMHISSTEKARESLGFEAQTGFDEGLAQTVAWYRANQAMWEKQMSLRRVPVKQADGSIEWY